MVKVLEKNGGISTDEAGQIKLSRVFRMDDHTHGLIEMNWKNNHG